ncbi:MAG: nqrC, partial [Bacteroidetes bacterium]|nr:nqrC [Bacteroidota bacterium]
MIGGIIIKIGFLSALAAAFFYYRAHRKKNAQDMMFARFSFHATVLALMAAGVIMLYLILTHQFQYTYVWNYSSTDLSLPLLISTFYAGQEGSFMLWALYTAIIGVFLLQYCSRNDYEPEVMSVYSLILSFLMTMLIFKNPFAYIWDSFPNDLVQNGPIPAGVTNYVVLDAVKGIWARFPVEGKGLWGPVWGYISLRSDMNTIYGATFDHKGETPGLGAEINATPFESMFIGKKLFEADKFVSIGVLKGGARDDDLHNVDAISGG